MQKQEKYEPIVFNLSRSQEIRQPKNYFVLFMCSLLMLGGLVIFAVWYAQKRPWESTTENGLRTHVPETAIPILPTSTPRPTAAPEPVPVVVEVTPAPSTPMPAPTPEVLTGHVTLNSFPGNAEVNINGKMIGHTPLIEYEIRPGTYAITFSYNGQISRRDVTITAGETATYTHRFEGFGSLNIQTTSSGSDITVNGKPVGKSPLRVEGLSPGTYTIVVSKVGYHTTEKTVTLGKGEHQDVFITIKRLGTQRRGVDVEPNRPLHPSERLQN